MHEVLDSRAELSDHPPPRKEAIDDNKENRRHSECITRPVINGRSSLNI